ncbi:MAG: class II glutamine amidotransferase [Myxococcota bacterium]|nr:class II glutamine amidotransferase [Myxococcota bacterium]
MCRLFGFRSNVPSRAHRSLIEAENAVANQASYHCDGWGIGYFLGEDAYVYKSEAGAAGDERFQRISTRLRSHTFVVHVRRATVGQVDYLNSHPFRHGAWMFAHNGNLYDFDKLRERMRESIEPELERLIFGVTDSEHFFYYLLSALGRAGVPLDGRGKIDTQVAARVLKESLSQVFAWAKELGAEPPKANFILTNGQVFIAQRAGLELYLATQKRTCADFDACTEPDKVCMMGTMPVLSGLLRRGGRRKCNHLLIASEPIGEEDIWEEIPDGTMVVMDDDFHLRLHPGPEPFWVTWPPPLKPTGLRPGVIPA